MPRHPFAEPRGRLTHISVRSEALVGNLQGDPVERPVAVYQSEGAESGRWPLLVCLCGFMGSGLVHTAWKAFEESLPQRIDRLVASGRLGPVVVAMPDCFTSLGGNQYIDSLALGGWARFLIDDMVPAIEARFPVISARSGRGVFGKSSGGYGAIAHGMLYPEAWGAVVCHSGDMAFDLVYQPHFIGALDRLSKALGRPIRDRADLDAATEKFVAGWDASAKVDGKDFHHLMTLAMAATYDPQADAPRGIRLPLDPWTGELDLEAWARWLAHDPVQLVRRPDVVENLRSLRGIWLDCGWKDQYAIHYGTRQLARSLAALGIDHRHEEFEDDHSSVNYRMDESLPWLYSRLSS